jgi:hypothetical protein
LRRIHEGAGIAKSKAHNELSEVSYFRSSTV